ncbi:S1 family peptidase [Streptomyces sp. NPDC127084]|uniref:S1 family peptidase n=1 Tax=Streptomyces sp. NPDC127084 TaxID=3347133 RepID=UPI0036612549
MRHARRTLQRIVRLAAVGGLVSGSLMVSNAVASEPAGGAATGSGTARAADPGAEPAVRAMTRLGTARTAGTWVGSAGRRVVAVTDTGAAAEVRRTGAEAKVVRYSMDRLTAATERLRSAPRVPGTAWAVDYRTNEVVVQADSTVSADDWERMSTVAEGIGGFVKMQRSAGAFSTRVNGAAPIFANTNRCSAGFNVTDGRESYILTAGHCGPVGTTWFGDRRGIQALGSTTAASFPGDDFALVRYGNGAPSGRLDVVEIGGGQAVRITGAADPVVGQQVFRSGSTTGLRTGRVTALNATVNYPEGTVTGLIQTTVCAEPGDSGGPLLAQGLALGVTSGGNGDCVGGGVTYFQPVTEALATLGVDLAGQPAPGDGSGAGTAPGAEAPRDPGNRESPGDAASRAPDAVAPAVPGPPAAGGADGTGSGGAGGYSGTGIVSDLASGLGPLGAVGPGLAVVIASLFLLVASRWIQSAQGRRNYRDYYSQTWA